MDKDNRPVVATGLSHWRAVGCCQLSVVSPIRFHVLLNRDRIIPSHHPEPTHSFHNHLTSPSSLRGLVALRGTA